MGQLHWESHSAKIVFEKINIYLWSLSSHHNQVEIEMGLNTINSYNPGEQHQENEKSGDSMVENKKKHKDEGEEEKDPDQDNSKSTATRRSTDPTAEGLPPMVEIATQTLLKLTNGKNTESQPESTANTNNKQEQDQEDKRAHDREDNAQENINKQKAGKNTSDILKIMRQNSEYGNMESLPFLTYILSPLLIFVGVAVAVAGAIISFNGYYRRQSPNLFFVVLGIHLTSLG